ncbi:maleylpyruvate isomerase N-terminal domain-containing protein [Kutzneria sp. NPDC052558]|uniref:maleylpyruvate isomerase N-terminal domain-containing protein n=1 Tax=Kutzneria sp. NPDC052558 TaxID=3364121 RepID=UPI0037C6FB17
MIAAFLSAARSAAALLRTPELAEAWAKPSALAEFRVSGLAGHLAGQVTNIGFFLDSPPLPDEPVLDAVRFYSQQPDVDVDSPVARGIRERSEANAGPAAGELAARYDAAVTSVAARLDGLDPAMLVTVWNRWTLPLDQCLLTRILELVIHADDLAVSIGVPTPEFADEVVDATVSTLARIAVRKRGTVPVLRALSRRERADAVATAF